MYERILVPTDGGPNMRQVVEEAAELASLTGATVHALYVVDAGAVAGFGSGSGPSDGMTADALREAGETAVGNVADWAGDVPVETEIRQGAPHREILAYADEADVDLVVMGTHGRTGLGRVLLGSVAERVIRLVDVPVLTVDVAEGELAVGTEDEAEAVARETLVAEGRDLADLREQPYRERSTWIVPGRTGDGAAVNVHVDATTGEARVADVES